MIKNNKNTKFPILHCIYHTASQNLVTKTLNLHFFFVFKMRRTEYSLYSVSEVPVSELFDNEV